MSALKDLYSAAFYDKFAEVLGQTLPKFDKKAFLSAIFDETWEAKELKERMRHTTLVLHRFFPKDFSQSVLLLKQIITLLRQKGFTGSLEFIFLPDYIELYGIEHLNISIDALEFVTQFISCEFAVRPFILKYGSKMTDQMLRWSLHHSAEVRRLSSEGIRPRLPWAMALPELKKNPEVIFPILENLKKDPSESVRRSVANNLNDISKDHPDKVLAVAARWKNIGKETDAIIKHACRTLLKKANPAIFAYYGLDDDSHVKIADFQLLTPNIAVGDYLQFSFSLTNQHPEPQTIRLEYGIYYRRQNGDLYKKVFKLSEKSHAANATLLVKRKQSFKRITTRTFYSGLHKLSLIVNGKERQLVEFELL